MDKIYKLRGLGCVQVDDSIWFSNHSFNALVEINKLSGQIQFMDQFPGYDIREAWLYTDVCYVEDRLIFIPGKSDKITSYDLKMRKFSFVGLDLDLVGEDPLYFWSAYVYGKYIYMLPRKAKCIVRYDVRDNTVKYLQTSLNAIILEQPEMVACFAGQFEVLDNMIYMPFVGLNAVAILDLEKEETTVKYLDIEDGCSTINYVDGYFYMASSTQPIIYQWEVKTGKIKKYDIFPKDFKGIVCDTFKLLFIGGINIDGKIYFFPFHSNMMISLDTIEKKIRRESDIYKDIEKMPLFYYVKKNKDKESILISNEDGISYWNCGKEGERESLNPRQDSPYNKRMISDYLLEKKYYNEYFEEENMLNEYLGVLQNSHKKEKYKQRNEYGKLIFDQLISLNTEVCDVGN